MEVFSVFFYCFNAILYIERLLLITDQSGALSSIEERLQKVHNIFCQK